MPLDKLKKSIELKSAENNSTPDLISQKIEEVKKSPGQNGDARVKDRAEVFGEQLEILRKKEPSIRPVVRAVRRLADCINEGSAEANAKVIENAKVAVHRVFDPETKRLIEVPDHKTRLAAVTLELAYVEGLPVKREIVLTGSFESGESVIERLKNSPEAMRLLGPVLEGAISPITSDNDESR